MKRKTISLILIICTSIISCKKTILDPSIPAPIPVHLDEGVTITNGINFDTGESVNLDPITGEKIDSCGEINIEHSTDDYANKMKKAENSDCLTQVVTTPPEVLNAINSTRSIFDGTVKKHGKTIPAKFVVQVTALFEGSQCETFYSGGNQYELCTSLEKKCSIFSNYTEPRRSRYNSKCNQFPFW